MSSHTPTDSVLEQVATWPGIHTQPTPRGAVAIVFADHELGHVHANRRTLDMPLAGGRREQVLSAARAREWFPGWVSKPLASAQDAEDSLALLRESYDELQGPQGGLR